MSISRFDNDFERTVYGKVKDMSINEFSTWLYAFYNKAWADGANHEDDEDWVRDVYPRSIELFPWDEEE